MAAARNLGSLTVDLIARTGGFTDGMSKAEREADKSLKAIQQNAERVGAAIAAALAVSAVAVAAGMKRAINEADNLSKAAQRAGVSIEGLSKLKFAGELSDLEFEELTGALTKLNKAIFGAGNGAKEQERVFAAMGVSVKDASGNLRAADDVLGDVAEAFKNTNDAVLKTEVATRLFGKTGDRLIPFLDAGRDGLKEFGDEAQRVGVVISQETGSAAADFNDSLRKLQRSIDGAFLQSLQAATPALKDFSKTISDPETQAGMQALVQGLVKIAEVSAKAVSELGKFSKFIGEEFAARISGPALGDVVRINEALVKVQEQLAKAEAATGRNRNQKRIEDLRAEEARLQNLLKLSEEYAPVAKTVADTLDKTGEAGKNAAEGINALVFGQENAEKAAQKAADAIKRLNDEAQRLRDSMDPGAAALRSLEADLAKLKATGGDTAELERFIDMFAEDLAGGLDKAAIAAREYERIIGVLQVLQDDGALSPERYNELAARAKRAWEEIRDGAADAGETIEDKLGKAFDDLRDSITGLSSDISRPFTQMINGLETIAKNGQKGAEATTKAYLRGYGQMAAGAAGFFNEQSRGYKTLQTVSQAFHAAELAMTIAELVPKGISAILGQGQGEPYSAFARMAAMAAIVAGLGVAVGGGGRGGPSGAMDAPRGSGLTTAGTILGDPKAASESVVKGIETLASIADKQLMVNLDMLGALRNIERISAGITNEFARWAAAQGVQEVRFGGTVGSIDQTVRQAGTVPVRLPFRNGAGGTVPLPDPFVDPGNAPDIAARLQEIFANIGSALTTAVGRFGGDVAEAERIFGEIEILDLVIREGEDLDKEIARLISAVSDSAIGIAADALQLGLAEFRRFGEGAAETLVRLVAQLDILDDVTGQLGVAVGQSIAEQIAAADQLAQMAGGVDKLADNVAEWFKFSLTESEKLERQGALLADVFASVGLALPGTREAVVDLVRGLDLTSEAGQRAFTAITAASDSLDDFFGNLEGKAEELAEFNADLLAQIERSGLSGEALQLFDLDVEFNRLRERAAQVGADLNKVEEFYGIRRNQIAQNLADQLLAQEQVNANRLLDLELRLLNAQGNAEGVLALQRQREIDAILRSTSAIKEREIALLHEIYAAEDAARAAAAAAQATVRFTDSAISSAAAFNNVAEERKQLENQLLQIVGAEGELRRRERAALSASNRALFDQIKALEDQRAATDALVASLDSALGGIRSLRKSIESEFTTAAGGSLDRLRQEFESVARRSRLGDIAALEALPELGKALRDASLSESATRADFLRDLAKINREAQAAEGVALRQKDIAEESFDQLAEQTLLLTSIKGSLEYLRDLAAPLQAVQASSSKIVQVPKFASGGAHSGGWRLVGERGPELEYTGPSVIYSNDMLAGLSNAPVVEELRKLREENRAGQFVIANNTGKTAAYTEREHDIIADWNENGLPQERAA